MSVAPTIPDTMYRWNLYGAGFGNLRLEKVDVPIPGPDDVLVRVDSISLCQSDYKVIKAGKDHPRIERFGIDLARTPTVLGHEVACTVVAVGETLRERFEVGQRYAVQADLRESGEAVGYNVPGGLQQFALFGTNVHDYLIRIPDGVGHSQASLTEPRACVYHSYDPKDIGKDDKLVWILGGAGPMGTMHVEYILRRKQEGDYPSLQTLLITEMSQSRLDELAHNIGDKAKGVEMRLVDLTGKSLSDILKVGEVDYAISCVPVSAGKAVIEAVDYVREGGVLQVFSGFAKGAPPEIELDSSRVTTLGDIHYAPDEQPVAYHGRWLTGTSGSTVANMQTVMDHLAAGHFDTNVSVVGIGGLGVARDGLMNMTDENVQGKSLFPGKMVIYPQIFSLPLLKVGELPGMGIRFGSIAGQVRDGNWSVQAEDLLNIQLAGR